MASLRDAARRYWPEALVVLLAAEAVVELALRRDSAQAPTTDPWLAAALLGLLVLPVFARRRLPFAAPAAYWLLAAALSFVDGRLVPFTTGVFVLGMTSAFLLGNLRDGLQTRIGLAVVVASAVVIVLNQPTHSASALVFIPMVFALCWLGGSVVRQRAGQAEAAEARAAQAERERDAAGRVAVAEERARIARELHDIVAHAVSVMVLQVGAVRHRLPASQAQDREALEGVERAGRTALAEMRRLLAAMRRNGDGVDLTPQPGLDGLEALAAEVGRAGLEVRLHVGGERAPLPRAVDLSAYRIVQEGLTNALKHARASRADVTLRYEPHDLRIEVRDDGAGAAEGDGLGHGLVGVRERVTIYGGEMSAGPAPEGGYVLRARLPLDGYRP